MKRIIFIAFTIFLLFILQSLPAYRLVNLEVPWRLSRLQADLGCILAIYLGMRDKSLLRGSLVAFGIGLVANNFAPSAMGVFTFLIPLCFLLTYISSLAFYFKRLEAKVLFLFFMSLIYNFIFFYLMGLAPDWYSNWKILFWPAVSQALMNSLFGGMLFTFFDWVLEDDGNLYSRRYRF